MERSADWMDQAIRDLAHAHQALATGYYEWACFSAQQAAEKAVKAVFQKLGAEVWGHVIGEMLDELTKIAPVAPEMLDDARELDKAYIPARYPDAMPDGSPGRWFTQREGARMVGYAAHIVEFCQGLLATL